MEKAYIAIYNVKNRSVDSGSKINVDFNPSSYTINGQVDYQAGSMDSGTKLNIEFNHLQSPHATFSTELTFDCYKHGESEDSMPNVNDKLKKLRVMMRKESELHAPPNIIFVWGDLSFVGVITSLNETYTMFLSNGKPVRAKATISIKGCRAEDLKPIVGHSPDRTKLHTVSDKDTLWSVAHKEYGSCADWVCIAAHNNIVKPYELTPGKTLVIPALPYVQERKGYLWHS